MLRPWKRRAVILAASVAAFFVIYTGVYRFWNNEAIARSVSGWISKPMRGAGGPTRQAFVIGRARYPYFGALKSLLVGGPVWVEMWDTTIWDPDGNEVIHAPYAHGQIWLGRLVWYLAWSQVVRHDEIELRFANCDAYGIRARITRDSTGGVNIVDTFASKNPKPNPKSGLHVRLDSTTIHDGDFTIGFPGWLGSVHHIEAKAELKVSTFKREQLADGQLDFTWSVTPLAAASGELRLGEGAGAFVFPMQRLVATRLGAFRGRESDLQFVATTSVHGAPLTVDGRLTDMFRDAGCDLTIDYRQGAGLLAMLPTRQLLVGSPSGSLRIHGPFSHVVIEGDARGAAVQIAGLYGREASGHFRFDSPRLHVSGARARLGGGTVGGDLDIDFRRMTLAGDLTAERVDPGILQPLIPLAARDIVGGRAHGSVHIESSLVDHPERIRVSRVNLALSRRSSDNLPRDVLLRGSARIAPERFFFDGLSFSGDGATVTARGPLDLERRVFDTDLALSGARLAPLLLRFGVLGVDADDVTGTAHLAGAIESPRLIGQLEAGRVAYRGYAITGLGARLLFDRGTLTASEIRGGGSLGRALSGSAALGLYDGDLLHRRAEPTVALALAARDLPIEALSRTPLIDGQASGRLRLDGTLAHPRGDLELQVSRLGLYGDPYHHGLVAIGIDGPVLTLHKLELARDGGGLIESSGGRYDNRGPQRLVDLDLRAIDFPLAAIPQLREFGEQLQGTLSGRARLQGSGPSWSLSGAIGATAVKVRDVLLGDGNLRFSPVGASDQEATRLSGEFFRRFNLEGVLRLLPEIGCEVRIRFDDYPLEELVPPLKKLRELHGVVSGTAVIAFDVVRGLRFAELRLDQVLLALTSEEAHGDEGESPGPDGLRTDSFRNVGDVIITTDGHKLTFQQARLRSRIGEVDIAGDVSATASDLTVNGQLQLELLEYFASSVFEHTHGKAVANLRVRGPAARPDLIGTLDFAGAELTPRGAGVPFQVPSGRIVFEAGLARLEELKVQLAGEETVVRGSLGLKEWTPGEIALQIDGALSPVMASWVFPDQISETSGRIRVAATVSGRWPNFTLSGRADLADVFFRAKRIGRDVRIAAGSVLFDGRDLVLGCPKPREAAAARPALPSCRTILGRVDDTSDVRIDGVLTLKGLRLHQIDVHLDGKDLEWSSPGIYSVTFSPDVTLYGDDEGLLIEGRLALLSGRYAQNFEYQDLVFKPRALDNEPPFYEGTPLLEDLALDLTASSTGPLSVKNNLADVNISVPGITINGTLSHPEFDGSILVEEGGRFNVPFLRAEFVSDKGLIRFEGDKEFPRSTPRLEIKAQADWQDRFEQLHRIFLVWSGTLLEPEFDLTSNDGWSKNQVLLALGTGNTADQIRSTVGANPQARPGSGGSSGSADYFMKQLTSDVFGRVTDPLKNVFKFDVLRFELGSDSVLFKVCPFANRNVKLCGTGDVGFVTSTRYNASGELKLSDAVSLLGLFERVERGVDTSQDTVNRLKLQLILRYPR